MNTKIDRIPSQSVTSLLPLIYVGWSDSVLSPSEIKGIRRTINNLHFLSKEDKAYLEKHLDPSNPPSEFVFKSWLRAIKKESRNFTAAQKHNLVELGLKIGQSGMDESFSDVWSKEETRLAFQKLEAALTIDNPRSAHILLKHIGQSVSDLYAEESWNATDLCSILDGKHSDIKHRMRTLLRDPVFKIEHEADKDIYRLRILEQVKALAKQGVSAYSFPKQYGGGEKGSDHIAVFEQLAYGDLSLTIKFGVQFGLFGGAIYLLGTEYHHKKYLEAMHRAELLGCFAMTETGHGSNVKGLETTATFDPVSNEIIIHSPTPNAGKEYIGNALHSEMAAVFAQLIVGEENHGVHAILVPIRDKKGSLKQGITIEDCGYKVGLNGVDNGRIWFNQVHVPRANLLNKYGNITDNGKYESPIQNPSKRFFTMLGALVTGRISVGLASVSATKKALTIATKYALNRRQFDSGHDEAETLIMDYPTHMERLIPAIASTYAYHFALQDLAEDSIAGDPTKARKIETLAAGLKSKASWHASETLQMCREACGGKGYLVENQFAALKGDSDIFTTFEGDNTVLMQLVAKGVLTEFKQSFHDDGNRAVISFLMKKMGHTLSEYNPINKRNADYKYLTSKTFITDSLKYRYEKSMIKLSERMRKYLKRRMDPYQAFLKTQLHMVDVADAYIDHLVSDNFVKAIKGCENEALVPVLKKLYQLYGLSTIYSNGRWYLENDYMEGNQSKAIRKIRNKIIQDLRPSIGKLVDSFGIPDELIAAPIALQKFS
ncbi:MAG: acyl-CoA oxidase [Saprospiraceae bacterium]|jgi:acyl-CoA oxidase